ncbi:hypothetical protein EDC65_2241 [Stella humosa]|uniref:Uncharacterized protein n=1 Tax=Stella humosa TaxID=94 RepID=A0A3N1M3Y2_9PROT|nr:hypothetical protein [Stella humosa]ROQ00442.1 hypothetical protein EDC65_2241 [Stella humosa]BBK30314.1 hypothetical protein STHU_09480 [Stella humosa]
MLRFWAAWRGGGMGPGHLPAAGGYGDQAAIMMDALHLMDAADARLGAEEKRRRDGR